MVNLLSQLTKDAQARLLDDLNYLNLQEIRTFCSDRGIPYKVVARYPNGHVKATKDTDRKPVVLDRVRRYLATGATGSPTCIPAAIVREGAPPTNPEPSDRLFYRWYAKEHAGVLQRLRELTDGRFADGAVARVLVMQFWSRGKAPTLAAFARAWTEAKTREHLLLTPEYAYLTDLKQQRTGSQWKRLRNARAKSALDVLAQISPILR
jgi:hypothetical protein